MTTAQDVFRSRFEIRRQLGEGGILVIPIGGRWEQDLVQVYKKSGKAIKEFLGGCRFVPLVGRCGFAE